MTLYKVCGFFCQLDIKKGKYINNFTQKLKTCLVTGLYPAMRSILFCLTEGVGKQHTYFFSEIAKFIEPKQHVNNH